MLEICALASGSNGNCYYIGNEKEAILVDAGISTKQILQRLYKQGLDVGKIKAVFITHEHGDHVRGSRVLTKKLGIPAYFSEKTYNAVWGGNKPQKATVFKPGSSFIFNSFKIHTFLKKHDAKEPCSFRVEHGGINIGVFTDIGSPCENVISHLNKCDALFLESNYDEKMLNNGNYPVYLKRRVASDVGHLSNKQAFELLKTHANPELKCVFLSHLSGENNTPELAYNEFKSMESRYKVLLTSRQNPSEIFSLKTELLLNKTV